jgi:beta-lactamase class D
MHGVHSFPTASPGPKSETIDLSRFFAGYRGAFVLYDPTENRTVRFNAAQCAKRVFPCSTFKIPTR